VSEPRRVGEDLEGIQARIAQVRAVQRAANRVPPPELYRCPVCRDSGFQTVSIEGRCTVSRCPKKCSVPKARDAARVDARARRQPAEPEVF